MMSRNQVECCQDEKMRLLVEILKCVKRHRSCDGATFIDLETNFERHGYHYKGVFSCTMPGSKQRILYWDGWKAEAFYMIGLLIEEGLIEKKWITPLAYMGKTLKQLPIIYNLKDLKQDGWIPILFVITPKGDECLRNL
ncbi:MAG: hypothetical protein RR310_06990 [Eubacterium sp.]